MSSARETRKKRTRNRGTARRVGKGRRGGRRCPSSGKKWWVALRGNERKKKENSLRRGDQSPKSCYYLCPFYDEAALSTGKKKGKGSAHGGERARPGRHSAASIGIVRLSSCQPERRRRKRKGINDTEKSRAVIGFSGPSNILRDLLERGRGR